MAEQWEISVTDSASILVEPRSATASYRYDLPAHVLVNDEAIDQLVTHIRDNAGTQWPKITVSIDAEEPTASNIEAALQVAGVTVERPAETIGYRGAAATVCEEDGVDADLYNCAESAEAAVSDDTRLGTPSRQRSRATSQGRICRTVGWVAERTTVFSIGIALLVVVIIAASWWSMQRALEPYELTVAQPSEKRDTTPKSPGNTTGDNALKSSGETAERGRSRKNGDGNSSTQRGVVLEHVPVRVEAPEGYRLSAQGDSYLLTGDDPNFRILLATDRTYSVPAEAVVAELHETVAGDPTLEPEESPLIRAGSAPQLSYREQPGDGSTVTWVVWVDHATQVSVGCHSRTTPTPAHRAVCRMVVDSFQLTDHSAVGTETDDDASIHIKNHARA